MKSLYIKLIIFGLLLIFISFFFIFGINEFFTLETIKNIKSEISAYKESYPIQIVILFILIYVTGTSLSLPVAGILSVAGGAIFGLAWGIIFVSIAGTLGATTAFMLSRYLFKDLIQQRYGEKLKIINEGIKKNGNIYLLSLRLIPIFPYFIINAVMGITPMPLFSFSIITLVGMVPMTSILVNGGVQIATISNVQDILSIKVLASFILIGLIPLLAHKFSRHLTPE